MSATLLALSAYLITALFDELRGLQSAELGTGPLEGARAQLPQYNAGLRGSADDAVDLLLEPLTLRRILRSHADFGI